MTDDHEPGDGRRVSRRSVLSATGALAGAGALATTTVAGGHTAEGCQPTGDGSSPQPGPPALYAEPADAPQFENPGSWDAEPLRVSGRDAYVDGEYLFQDFVYDDNGANTTPTGRSGSATASRRGGRSTTATRTTSTPRTGPGTSSSPAASGRGRGGTSPGRRRSPGTAGRRRSARWR